MLDDILEYQRKLQMQSQVPMWSLANEDVVFSAAQKKRPAYGAKGKIIFYLGVVFTKIKLSDFLIFSCGLFQILHTWKKMHNDTNKTVKYPQKIFVGFGASSEKYLWRDYNKPHSAEITYINSVTCAGMSVLGRPRFRDVMLKLYREAFGHTAKLRKAIPEIYENKYDFITVCAKNIGIYAFFCIYWDQIKLKNIQEVVYLAPDVSCFACVQAGIPTLLIQHGLLGLGILFPSLSAIYALTSIESLHLKNLLPFTKISLLSQPDLIKTETEKENLAIILLPTFSQDEWGPLIKRFILWLKSLNMTIVIRGTSKARAEDILFCQKIYSQCLVDDLNSSFYESLNFWQPKFVVGWTSTCLALALEAGFLPISLKLLDVEHMEWRMVYPLLKRVLFWPHDSNRLIQVSQSKTEYQRCIEHLLKQG